MMEHPVAAKLLRDIVPWLVALRRLRGTRWYAVGQIYKWGSEILAALAAAGLTSGFARATGEPATNIWHVLSDPVANISLIILAIFVILKVAVINLHLVERVIAADACLKQVRLASGQLHVILAGADPMRGLDQLYESVIAPTVQRANNEELSPIAGLEPSEGAMVAREVDRYVRLYSSRWAAPPPRERDGKGGGGW